MTEQEIIKLFEDESEHLEIIEEGEWEQDYKYQFLTNIVKHTLTNKYWAVHQQRSGSPFSDWNYEDSSANEVVKVEKMQLVVSWEAV